MEGQVEDTNEMVEDEETRGGEEGTLMAWAAAVRDELRECNC